VSAPVIAVVDYGMGNRRSVEKALDRVGARAIITDNHAQLLAADGLLLPGVGAFPAAMAQISRRGLDGVIADRAAAGTPIFGSCLGMQLLFEHSDEHGGANGLGLLPGTVTRLEAPGLKLPHIGWSAVHWRGSGDLVDDAEDVGVGGTQDGGLGAGPVDVGPGTGLPNPTFLYHVHTYVARPSVASVVAATAEYGEPFAAVVGRGNVWGTQSHPEKSSTQGLRLLAGFVAMCATPAAATTDGSAAAGSSRAA
jgi:glutamine amidotransferase